MWFVDAPTPTGTLGSPPNAVVNYVAQPNDGRHLWVVSVAPMAKQQSQYADEFAIMPDALLNGEGYRLSHVAHLQLPAEMVAVLENGPDALNHRTHPLRPTLMTICEERTLAISRTFGPLNVHTSLFRGDWILVICPVSTTHIVLTNK